MTHKLFYAWQSERPGAVCRHFIREALDSISKEIQQSGIDERVEVDSDTQNVPGVPEIVGTIFRKIEEDDVFVADLTMCSETTDTEKPRRSPNANVMFEYGFAMKAKSRDRLICVMNTFYGGSDPAELPFDLRHARAPIRYSLAPGSASDERKKVLANLRGELLAAAKLIIDNLPSQNAKLPHVSFDRPHFVQDQELTPEGDFSGQENPTFFSASGGFVYLRGRPLDLVNLSIADIKKMEVGAAGIDISARVRDGSHGSNKWGRVSYSLYIPEKKRLSADYVQYFRTGEIEMVNGSYLTILGQDEMKVVHVGYIVTQIITPMLAIAKQWIEKADFTAFFVEVGVIGIEGWKITLNNFGTRGPMIHANKVSVQKRVDKESILLLAQEFQSALLAEAGLS
jgi:hypothetical protein